LVQIPKFGANRTSGFGDIANPKCMCENPVRAKIGFAISPEPLIRFASNFGIWTRFLQGLRAKIWAKSIRALYAPFFQFFALSCAILFYALSAISKNSFCKKVSIWWENNTPWILKIAHQNWQRDGAPKIREKKKVLRSICIISSHIILATIWSWFQNFAQISDVVSEILRKQFWNLLKLT
jgi:hypothetical protein